MEVKIKDGVMFVLISDVYSRRHEDGLKRLYQLLQVLVDEQRKVNDSIQPEDLKESQGQIKAFQQLANYIEFGIGIPQNR